MRGSSGVIALVVAGFFASGCSRGPRDAVMHEGIITDLMESYARGDYFAIRDQLAAVETLNEPRVTFLRAATATAFNELERSNRALATLDGGEGLPDALRAEMLRLRFANSLRLGEYRQALEAAETLLAAPEVDSTTRADVENEVRAVSKLVEVPPLRVVSRGPSEIQRRPDGRVPVQVGDSAGRGYVWDTGANLSTLMRSEAAALGLQIQEAGIRVGTSTGSQVTADVAVAGSVRMGNVELGNVVFLVVPDEVLTFGPDFRIPGIIGFPVIDALGEVRYLRGGRIEIPGRIPERSQHNLALEYLTLRIHADISGRDAICDLDTGANKTSLLEPFYLRYRAWVEENGQADTIRTAGVGGERRMPSYVLTEVRVGLGDTTVTLQSVPVYTESVAQGGSRAADCRLGLDVLSAFDGYLINLRSMTFVPI